MKSAKAYRKHLADHGIFYTDPKLAQAIREHLPASVKEVYDPTCGIGNLLASFPDDVRKYGQELDAESAEEAAKNLVNAEIVAGDTLVSPAFMDRRFDAIAANYPFSVAWAPAPDDLRFSCAPALAPKNRADYAFILHCLYMLSDTGTAAVLSFPGVLYRGNAEGKIRKWLVEQNVIESITDYEGGYFEDTSISTSLIVLRKNRPGNCITMTDHEHGVSRDVPVSEIVDADYCLSVRRFVDIPRPKEETEYDPPEVLMKSILDSSLEALKGTAELQYNLITALHGADRCMIEPYKQFLRDVSSAASEYLGKMEKWERKTQEKETKEE